MSRKRFSFCRVMRKKYLRAGIEKTTQVNATVVRAQLGLPDHTTCNFFCAIVASTAKELKNL